MFARHFAANFFNLLVIICIVIAGAVHWAKKQYEIDGPLTSDINFEVKKGDRFKAVAISLEELGIIYNSTIFKIGARYAEQDDKLKFGNYLVPRKASMRDVIALITSGRAISEQVTFPEGFTSYQIVERLNAIPELIDTLDTLPMEGSLAPNTYAYIKGDSRKVILKKMIDAQSEILDNAWINRSINLPYNSKKDILIIASIIEKETGLGSERSQVASVFANRLRKDMALQTDPAVIYGITRGKILLGRGLLKSDLKKDTPWNTYLNKGLPLTPISNPGRDSLRAALTPDTTKYIFFVADGKGGHAFSETYAEHQKNVKVWRAIEASK